MGADGLERYYGPAGQGLARPAPRAARRETGDAGSDVVGVLWRRKWWILGGLVSVLAAAIVLTMLWPPTYESSAMVLVEQRQPGGGDVPGLTILDRLETHRTLDTEAELLRSRNVIESAVEALGLHAALAREYGMTPEEAMPRAVSSVRERVSVLPLAEEGDLLEVACTGSDADAAHDLCAAVTSSYVALRASMQRSEASSTASFLRGQVSEYADRLVAAEDTLRTFAIENQGVALGEQASEEVRTYAGVRAQRDQIEAERRALAGLLDRAERQPGGARKYRDLASFPTLMQNQGVSQLLTHLSELESRRSELAQRRTEANPELAALDRRINDIDGQLGEMARSYERSLASQVTSLNQVVGGSTGRLADFPERQVEMARLERQVASLASIHDLLEARLREAEVAEAVSQPAVRVVDEATMPLAPSSPRPLFNLVLAFILGTGFGLALALAREGMDSRIHGRRELENLSALPIVAMIPLVKPAGPLLPVERAAEGDAARPPLRDARGESVLPARQPRALRKLGALNGRGVAVEAFRSLGTDLEAISRQIANGEIRSLAVTSPGRGDGKTFVSCNLALTRAAFGVHTLLIDGDMRAGGVARFFDLPPVPGLSELLSGAASARDARHALRVGDTDTLAVMPAGSPTDDAAELLQTSYFEAMLAGAQAVYDLVVIDTPPLNVLPDTAAIAPHVDGVLVVVRDDVTDARALELTLERLERTGAHVLGIVFNDVSLPGQYAYGSESAHA